MLTWFFPGSGLSVGLGVGLGSGVVFLALLGAAALLLLHGRQRGASSPQPDTPPVPLLLLHWFQM